MGKKRKISPLSSQPVAVCCDASNCLYSEFLAASPDALFCADTDLAEQTANPSVSLEIEVDPALHFVRRAAVNAIKAKEWTHEGAFDLAAHDSELFLVDKGENDTMSRHWFVNTGLTLTSSAFSDERPMPEFDGSGCILACGSGSLSLPVTPLAPPNVDDSCCVLSFFAVPTDEASSFAPRFLFSAVRENCAGIRKLKWLPVSCHAEGHLGILLVSTLEGQIDLISVPLLHEKKRCLVLEPVWSFYDSDDPAIAVDASARLLGPRKIDEENQLRCPGVVELHLMIGRSTGALHHVVLTPRLGGGIDTSAVDAMLTPNPVMSVAWLPQETVDRPSLCAFGTASGRVAVFDVGNPSGGSDLEWEFAAPISGLRWCETGRYLVAAQSNGTIINLQTLETSGHSAPHAKSEQTTCLDTARRMAAFGTDDGSVFVGDLEHLNKRKQTKHCGISYRTEPREEETPDSRCSLSEWKARVKGRKPANVSRVSDDHAILLKKLSLQRLGDLERAWSEQLHIQMVALSGGKSASEKRQPKSAKRPTGAVNGCWKIASISCYSSRRNRNCFVACASTLGVVHIFNTSEISCIERER